MSQEKPKLPYGLDDPRHELVRSFVRRLFEIEDVSLPLSNITEIAREELRLEGEPDHQVRSVIRHIGANFFPIFGLEQPRSSKKHKVVMDQIHDELTSVARDSADHTTR